MDLHVALVQPIAYFVQIASQVPHGNVVVHAHDSALQKCPHALDGVGVDVSAHELLGLVPHGLVLVGQVLQAGVGSVLVGVDRAAVLDVVENLSLHHVRIRRKHGHRYHLALAPAQSQHRLLSHRSTAHLQLLGLVLVGLLASEVLLVGLHHAREERLLVAARLLDAMEHVPGRLLRPVQLLRELQRGDALARDADLVHDPQPLPNRYPGRLHDGAHLARELLATVLAVVVVLARRVGVGVQAPAFRAEPALRPTSGLEELHGVVLVADPFQELPFAHCRVVRHCP